jgi:hypothetical protein
MLKIAIPSYKRPETLQRKTLALLKREGFPAEAITVFVADEEELAIYKKAVDRFYKPAFVVGRPGIHRQRRFIEQYYPPGTKLLCFDDDISAIKRPFNAEPLPQLFEKCFEIAQREGCRLWGIYPCDHGMSLKNRAVKGLTYVIGACFGLLIGGPEDSLDYPDPFTEDFTRSVEYFKRGWGVLRFEGLGPTTRYFKEPGGLQMFRTPETQEEQMERFALTYYEYASIRRRKGKMVDARLDRIIEAEFVKPFTE